MASRTPKRASRVSEMVGSEEERGVNDILMFFQIVDPREVLRQFFISEK